MVVRKKEKLYKELKKPNWSTKTNTMTWSVKWIQWNKVDIFKECKIQYPRICIDLSIYHIYMTRLFLFFFFFSSLALLFFLLFTSHSYNVHCSMLLKLVLYKCRLTTTFATFTILAHTQKTIYQYMVFSR